MTVVRMGSMGFRYLLAPSVAFLGACASGSSPNAGTGSGSSSGVSIHGTSSSGASSSGTSSSGASSSGGGESSSGTSSSGSGSSSGSSSGPSGDDSGSAGDDGSPGTGDDGGAASDDGGSTGTGAPSSSCFPAGSGTDFTSDGPLTATSADNTSVACTIFQPTVLGSAGCLNPVIIWGNGTFNTPSNYTALFNHFASQGFIVAAADTSNSGSGMEMLACLSYILSQNTTSGSSLFGHIDTKHIASSGYSQGAPAAWRPGKTRASRPSSRYRPTSSSRSAATIRAATRRRRSTPSS